MAIARYCRTRSSIAPAADAHQVQRRRARARDYACTESYHALTRSTYRL